MVERYDIERYYQKSHRVIRWIEHRRLKALRQLAAPAPDDRVLEVGCGAGHVLELFAGSRRFAIDLSPRMLRRARVRLGKDVQLAQSAAECLPFPDAHFDVVICTEVLEHSLDPAAVVRELVRVTSPRGRVVVSIPNEANIDRAKRTIRRLPVVRRLLRNLAAEGNEWHLHQFDLSRLRDIVDGTARIAELKGVPGRILPIRYVALLRSAREVLV